MADSDDGSFARKVNVGGLLAELLGVLILFRFGMPFQLPIYGMTFLAVGVDAGAVVKEHLFAALGYFGTALVVAGTLAQIYAASSLRTSIAVGTAACAVAVAFVWI